MHVHTHMHLCTICKPFASCSVPVAYIAKVSKQLSASRLDTVCKCKCTCINTVHTYTHAQPLYVYVCESHPQLLLLLHTDAVHNMCNSYYVHMYVCMYNAIKGHCACLLPAPLLSVDSPFPLSLTLCSLLLSSANCRCCRWPFQTDHKHKCGKTHTHTLEHVERDAAKQLLL